MLPDKGGESRPFGWRAGRPRHQLHVRGQGDADAAGKTRQGSGQGKVGAAALLSRFSRFDFGAHAIGLADRVHRQAAFDRAQHLGDQFGVFVRQALALFCHLDRDHTGAEIGDQVGVGQLLLGIGHARRRLSRRTGTRAGPGKGDALHHGEPQLAILTAGSVVDPPGFEFDLGIVPAPGLSSRGDGAQAFSLGDPPHGIDAAGLRQQPGWRHWLRDGN